MPRYLCFYSIDQLRNYTLKFYNFSQDLNKTGCDFTGVKGVAFGTKDRKSDRSVKGDPDLSRRLHRKDETR